MEAVKQTIENLSERVSGTSNSVTGGSLNTNYDPDEQRVAIVTGAALGMGEGLSQHFIKVGWRVALFDVNEDAGKKLADSLGERALFHRVDVSSYASQTEGFKAVWAKWGRIDAYLGNAGIVERSSIYIFKHRGAAVDDVPPEPNLLCTDVDWKGVLYGTQLSVHFMRHNATPGGKIVVTASNAGIHPHESYPEYSGVKAGVIGFVRATAQILHDKENIDLNCVCPGIVATKIIPPEMVAAVQEEALTPIDTIVRAYDNCIRGGGVAWLDGAYGRILECSADKIGSVDYTGLKFRNGFASDRSVQVWDPLFQQIHGEPSGLKDAIL